MARFGMDVGTGTTVLYDAEGGFQYDEPSVMLGRPHGQGVSVGREAAELVDRVPSGAHAVRPVRDGVITDLETARRYLRAVVRRVFPRPWQRTRLTAALTVPAGASPLERRALVEAAEEAGIVRVLALAGPVAGAIGCGVDPLDRRVHMVADVGAGTAEIVALCFGEILAVRSRRVAGDAIAAAVRRHVREQHHLVVGRDAAEELTIRAGAAPDGAEVVVVGRDGDNGRPRTLRLRAAELHGVVAPRVAELASSLIGCLDDLPARALDDLAADGVLLVGGASPTRGLRAALEAGLGLPVKQAENPSTCVAEGAARAFTLPGVLEAYTRA
ncbi:rod shape-determining protein [Pseudonocardia sp. RS010]|uniref:rod shape-determining protein n=1 Tax=Pseudonocardia sp. RS010 TaxID=3385979 RepID=UPI0039A03DEB